MNAMALSWPWIMVGCEEGMVQHIFKYHPDYENTSLCDQYTIAGDDGKPIRVSLLPHGEGRDHEGACRECVGIWNRLLRS